MTIILFLAVLIVLILVHETGHFIFAKLTGMRVDEFGIGFPPRIVGKRFGETLYSVNAVPFGGFVKIFGEDPTEGIVAGPDAARSFSRKPAYAQALVLVAGVLFNVLLGWFLYSAAFMTGMPTVVEEADIALVENPQLTILNVLPDSPSEEAGFEPGDILLAMSLEDSGAPLKPQTATEASSFIASHPGEKITVEFARDGETKGTTVIPRPGLIAEEPERAAIGTYFGIVGTLQLSPFAAIVEGGKQTISMLQYITVAFIDLIAQAVQFKADLSQVAGPIGIVGLVGDAASVGIVALMSFTALISINLAVINLLPFPALDGGRLLFVLIETVKGSPIKPAIANTLNVIGFALLILLMIAVTYHDILRLLS
jgi:regulator of sigma E protease